MKPSCSISYSLFNARHNALRTTIQSAWIWLAAQERGDREAIEITSEDASQCLSARMYLNSALYRHREQTHSNNEH